MRLLWALRQGRVPARLSRDAGTYLCNYVYWRALEAAAVPGGPHRVVFIHVPRVGQKFRARARVRRREFTLDQLFRAGDAVLAAVGRR